MVVLSRSIQCTFLLTHEVVLALQRYSVVLRLLRKWKKSVLGQNFGLFFSKTVLWGRERKREGKYFFYYLIHYLLGISLRSGACGWFAAARSAFNFATSPLTLRNSEYSATDSQIIITRERNDEAKEKNERKERKELQ